MMCKCPKRILLIVALYLFNSWFSLIEPVAATPTDSRFDLLSAQLFSDSKHIAILNDTAYCAFDPGLVIIDFTDQANPVLISETYLNSRSDEIHLLGNTAIMLASQRGLIMIDVSDARNPLVTGEFLDYPSPISMTLEDSIGFLLYESDPSDINGLVTVDLFNPIDPQILDTFEVEAIFERIAVQQEKAFISANREGLLIIDIEKPDSLELIFSYDPFTYQGVTNCIVRDSLVYIGSQESRWIQILSMTSEDSLVLIGQITSGIKRQIRAMALVQDYLYLSGFQIIDVSDPTHPVVDTSLDLSHGAHQFLLSNELLYIPNRISGIEVWNVESPTAPELLGTYNTSYLQAIDVDANHAYITRWDNGLYIYSIEDLGDPELKSFLMLDGPLSDVLVKESYLYIANGDEGVIVLDVADPSQPQLISSYRDSLSKSNSLALRDSLLFVGEYQFGMKILDISDPVNPRWISSFLPSIEGDAEDISLGGNFAYIANFRGIVAVDISNPANPVEVAIYNAEENRKNAVEYYADIIYYQDAHASDFYVRDVTDPSASLLLFEGGLPIGPYVWDFFMNFPILFLADGGVIALEVTDPEHPFVFDQFYSSHLSFDLAGNDSLIFSVYNSFVILDFDRTGLGIGSDPPLHVLPKSFSLSQNYPNPFNPSTTIRYDIPRGSGSVQVKVFVYDIRGRRVRTLIDSEIEPGTHKIHWEGRNDRGKFVASGIYLYTLRSGDKTYTRKMLMLK